MRKGKGSGGVVVGVCEGVWGDRMSFCLTVMAQLSMTRYKASKRDEMSLLPNTKTTRNNYAACGRKDNTNTAQKHKTQ
jgi:hypothetical protein